MKINNIPFNSIDLPGYKFTASCPIETIPLPEKVIIPLLCYGNEYAPTVNKGQAIVAGEGIGTSDNPVMPPIVSTISGEVTGIIKYADPFYGSLISAVAITSDGQDKWIEPEKSPRENASGRTLLKLIEKTGIYGLGGGGFPLYIKLLSALNAKVNTLVINGMECEPYLTSDYRLMIENAHDIISGTRVFQKILSPQQTIIAVNDRYPAAIASLENAAADMEMGGKILISPFKSVYPSGAEELLVKTILKREVPPGRLPQDIGASIHSIATVKSVNDVMTSGLPPADRTITASGNLVKRANLKVRIGTPLSDIINYCGGIRSNNNKIILGGPMTGRLAHNLEIPITPPVFAVLALTETEMHESECIRCGKCIDVCPVSLSPVDFYYNARISKYEECSKYGIDICFECGNCAFSCPSGIPLMQYIKIAKREIKLRGSNS
ncbi:MAG: electron transport complex subunit RsxC [Dehalococcoidales bacterium]|nr:electron transport complex subunit RsxC [Dehalococcoidales bacterium]NLE90910.1 electron transport complex subunit RsxC [Dehalococcoidales bacterium]